MSVTAILRMRRDDASNWSTANPVIESGQLGFETDTGLFKLGNGVSSWNALPYVTPFAASAGTQSAGVGTLNFSDSNGISFGVSSGTNFQHTITASFSGGGGGGPTISVSGTTNTGSQSTGTVVFDTSPTLRFGYSAGTITGSVLGGGGGVIATTVYPLASASSAGTVTRYAGEDHRHVGPTISAATGSAVLSALTFNNNAGLAFGIAGNVITGSYTVPTVPAQTQPTFTIGTNAATSTVSVGNLNFANSHNITFGLSGSTITASASGGGAADGWNPIAAGGSTANSTMSVVFGNANNMSFSLNGSTITGSAPLNVSAGANSSNLTRLMFGDSNGLSFGYSNGSVTGNYSQSNQAFSASGGSSAFQTLQFANNGGVTFSNSGGSVVGVYTLPTVSINYSVGPFNDYVSRVSYEDTPTLSWSADSPGVGEVSISAYPFIRVSASTQSSYLSEMTFANGSGVTFGLNAGTITASVATNYLTSQSNQALSGSNGSYTFQTATFGSSNGLHFYSTNGSMVASMNASIYAAGTNSSGTSVASFNGQSLSFSGLGVVSIAVQDNKVFINAPAAGGDGVNVISISGNTTGTANTYSTGTMVFAGGNNITLSQSSNTISINGPSAGAAVTFSSSLLGFDSPNLATVGFALAQNSVYVFPAPVHNYVAGSLIRVPIGVTASNNTVTNSSSYQIGYSLDFGWYSRVNNSNSSNEITRIYSTQWTASAHRTNSAGSHSWGVITAIQNSTSYLTANYNSTNQGASTAISGQREILMPFNTTIAPGEYWIAYRSSSSTAGATTMSASLLSFAVLGASSVSYIKFGTALNSTNRVGLYPDIGIGILSVSTGALPNTIAFSNLNLAATVIPTFFEMATK